MLSVRAHSPNREDAIDDFSNPSASREVFTVLTESGCPEQGIYRS